MGINDQKCERMCQRSFQSRRHAPRAVFSTRSVLSTLKRRGPQWIRNNIEVISLLIERYETQRLGSSLAASLPQETRHTECAFYFEEASF
jgi:hypothetical protein